MFVWHVLAGIRGRGRWQSRGGGAPPIAWGIARHGAVLLLLLQLVLLLLFVLLLPVSVSLLPDLILGQRLASM